MARTRQQPPFEKPEGEYHHGDLRRAILQAAVTILAESGSEAFTLREAARRIGVNHRAVYRHFVDREAVLAAVAEQGYRRLLAGSRAALATVPLENTRARLVAIAQTHLEFAMREPADYLVMTGPRLNEGGRFPELELPIAEGFAAIAAELRAGVEREDLVALDLTEATMTLFATLHGLATLVITRRIRVRPDQLRSYTEQAIGHLLRGFWRVRS